MPGERQTPTVRLRRLAAELRSLRTSSGLTRDEIVERTGINVATLYRIEHARVRPQTRTLRTLLDLYGVEGAHQDELIALLRDARQRGWLHAYQSVLPEQYTTYIGFEGEARGVWNYESLFVPGLVQTEDYAYIGCMAGELFLEEESDVRRYKLVFDHLRAVADSPDAARSLITGLVAQI
jgi:transcriptional regulator with XRE-family HTH domain